MNKNLLKGLVALLIAVTFLLPGAVLVAGAGGADGEQAGAESFESEKTATETQDFSKSPDNLQPCVWQEQDGKHVACGKDFSAVFTSPENMVVYTDTTSVSISCKPPTWAWTSAVDGDTVTYSNSLNNVDVEYKITKSGIKETIILNQKTPRNWVFKYRMTNLAEWEYNGHHIRMWKIEGDLVTEYIIPKGNAWDSAGATSEVTYECKQDPDNADAFSVKLVLNKTFLTDATYPIYVDPTLSIYSKAFNVLMEPTYNLLPNTISSEDLTSASLTVLDSNTRAIIASEGHIPLFRKEIVNFTQTTGGESRVLNYNEYFAQCFNASSNYTLPSIQFYSRTTGTKARDIHIRLYADNGSSYPSGPNMSSPLTEDLIYTIPASAPYEWRTLAFSNAVDIVNGERYWIVYSSDTGATDLELYFNTTNQYTEGYLLNSTDKGSTWSQSGLENHDLLFRTYSRTATFMEKNGIGGRGLWGKSYDGTATVFDVETPLLPKSEHLLANILRTDNNSLYDSDILYGGIYNATGSKINDFEYVFANATPAAWESRNTISLIVPSSTSFSSYHRNLKIDLESLGFDWDAISYIKIRRYEKASASGPRVYLYNLLLIGDCNEQISIAPADRRLISGQHDYAGFYLTAINNSISYLKLKFENISSVENVTVNDLAIEPVGGLYNVSGISIGQMLPVELRLSPQIGDVRFDIKILAYNSTHDLIGTNIFKYPSLNIPAIKVMPADDYILSKLKGKSYFAGDLELFNKNNMTMNHTVTYILKYQGVEIWRNETNLTIDNASTRYVKKYVALAREGLYSLETTFAFVEYGKNRTYVLSKDFTLGKKADVSKTNLPLELWKIKGNSLQSFAVTIYNNNTLYANEFTNATYYIVVNNNGIVTTTKWENLAEGLNTKTLSLYTPGTGYGNAFVDIKVYKKLDIAKLALIYPEASKVNLTATYGITGSDVFGFLLYSQNTTINEKAKPLAAVGWTEQASEWFTAYWMYVAAGIAALAVIAILYAAASKPGYRKRR